jgi:hypothetical protein
VKRKLTLGGLGGLGGRATAYLETLPPPTSICTVSRIVVVGMRGGLLVCCVVSQLDTIHGLDGWLVGLLVFDFCEGRDGRERDRAPAQSRADPRGENLGCEGGCYQIRKDDISKTVTGTGVLIGVC